MFTCQTFFNNILCFYIIVPQYCYQFRVAVTASRLVINVLHELSEKVFAAINTEKFYFGIEQSFRKYFKNFFLRSFRSCYVMQFIFETQFCNRRQTLNGFKFNLSFLNLSNNLLALLYI